MAQYQTRGLHGERLANGFCTQFHQPHGPPLAYPGQGANLFMSGIAINFLPEARMTLEALAQGGRRYIQNWLQLVDQGFEACPNSTLINLPKGQGTLKRHLKLSGQPSLIKALRFGKSKATSLWRVRRDFKDYIILK